LLKEKAGRKNMDLAKDIHDMIEKSKKSISTGSEKPWYQNSK